MKYFIVLEYIFFPVFTPQKDVVIPAVSLYATHYISLMSPEIRRSMLKPQRLHNHLLCSIEQRIDNICIIYPNKQPITQPLKNALMRFERGNLRINQTLSVV